MPLTVTRVTPNTYHSCWSGFVSYAAAIQTLDEVALHLELHDENAAVLVIELVEGIRIQFGIQECCRMVEANPRVVGYVFVGGPFTAHVIVGVLRKMTTSQFAFAETMDAAVSLAPTMLEYAPTV
jgi:hypothetical protein